MEVPTVKRIIIVESIAREPLRDTLIKIQNPLRNRQAINVSEKIEESTFQGSF